MRAGGLLEKALRSVEERHGGDARRVTLQLRANDLAQYDPVGGGAPRARVRLFTAERAACKHGRFLLRPQHNFINKVDHFAYVPYSTETPAQQRQAIAQLRRGVEPPCPDACNAVLEVQALVRWRQCHEVDENGVVTVLERPKEYRLAVGEMTTLDAVSKADCAHLFEVGFCDGSDGRRKRFPSLLRKSRRRSYPYAVWLRDVEAAMVSAVDASGVATHFIPPLKSSRHG